MIYKEAANYLLKTLCLVLIKGDGGHAKTSHAFSKGDSRNTVRVEIMPEGGIKKFRMSQTQTKQGQMGPTSEKLSSQLKNYSRWLSKRT